MLLGEGKRGIGEPCWSHAQCYRGQANSHCLGLICMCDTGFHNYEGKCSRNIWEDLGLHYWELMIVAFVLTIVALMMFIGTVYFIISKIARFRQTSPEEQIPPEESFDKRASVKGVSSASGKTARAFETQLVDRGMVESQLVKEEDLLRPEQDIRQTAAYLEPSKFILPLSFRHNSDSDYSRSDLYSRSSWSSASSTSSGSSGGWVGARWPGVGRAWAGTAGAGGNPEDEWYHPRRNHARRTGTYSPTGTARLPLLLRASTLSESDESP